MIRSATLEDVDQIVSLGEQMRAETQALREGRLPYPGIERQRVHETVQLTINHPTMFFAAVAETDHLVGMMGGSMCLWAFSSLPLATENNIYVEPGARKTKAAHGFRLMQAFEDWAIENGAVYAKVGVYTGMEEVGAFYERLGYEFIGEEYIKCVQAHR